MNAKSTFKPAAIRNLTYLAPEGSTVGVWQDKKDSDRYFVAETTKTAGWSEFKNRKQLTEVAGYEGLVEALGAIKGSRAKVAKAVIEHLEAHRAQVEAEAVLMAAEILAEQAQDEAVVQVTIDEEFEALLVRAQNRTPERNEQLVVELKAEIPALMARENIDETKRQAMISRKEKMIVACEQAAAEARA